MTSNGGRDRAAFGVIDLSDDGAPGPIRIVAERTDAEAENAVLSEDGTRALLIWNAAGRSEIELEIWRSLSDRLVSGHFI